MPSKLPQLLDQIQDIKEKAFRRLSLNLPSWCSPNLLSLLRAALIIPIFFLFRQEKITWVIIIFSLAMITDVLDGVHARTTGRVSSAGKLLDPAADKIIFIGLFLLVAPGRLNTIIIDTIISLEIILVFLATVIGPLAFRLLKIKIKLGANLAGKIKLNLEGLAMIILLFGLNKEKVFIVSEMILWLAAGFAFSSIILHLLSREINQNTSQPFKN